MSLKAKTIIISIFLSLISLFIIFFLIFPSLKVLFQKKEELLRTKKEFLEIEVKTRMIQEFKKDRELKENLLIFEKSLIDREFPMEFIDSLEKLAKKENISIEISLKPSQKDLLSFEIKAIGSPQNLFRFFEKIENLPFLIQAEKLSISKMAESELKKEGVGKIFLSDLKLIISLNVQTK